MKLVFLLSLISFNVLNAQVTAVKDSITTKEDSITTILVQSNDVKDVGCTNETTILINAKHGTAIRSSNLQDVVYTPNTNFFGFDSFQYQIRGCASLSTSVAWVKVYVKPINRPPDALFDFFTLNEDELKLLNVKQNDTDREKSNLSVTIYSIPKNGNIFIPNLDSVIYTPYLNYYGKDSFQYRICDDGSGSISLCDTAWVRLQILPVDDTLISLRSDTLLTVIEKDSICADLSSMILDVDNEYTWTLSAFQSPNIGLVRYSNKSFCYKSNLGFNGMDSFVTKACDANGNCQKLKVRVKVIPLIDTIFAVVDTYYVTSNTTYSFDPGTNDINPDNSAYLISNIVSPKNGSITQSGNLISYTSALNFRGRDSLYYSISRSDLNYKSVGKVIFIVGVNKIGLKAYDDYYSMEKFIKLNLTPMENDWIDNTGPGFNINIISHPKNITLTNTTIGVYETISNSYIGYDTCVYRICNDLGCDTARMYFKITHNLKPRTKVDTTYLKNPLQKSNCLSTSIISMDTPHIFSLVRPSTKNIISIDNKGCWIYDYPKTYEGIDSFFFKVCHSSSPFGCDTQIHYIVVINEKSPLVVSNSFSPNGDGKDDFFVIDNIERTISNKLVVFNRWGNVVYSKENYQNNWAGSYEKDGVSEELLPDGVYYYVFDFVIDNQSHTQSGYIYLKK